MTQRIFVGHHDRTRALLCSAKNPGVRGKGWTRQTLSDAWDATNWDGLCGTPWPMVAPEFKLTKKVTADKEGAGPPIAKDCGLKERRKLILEDFAFCLRSSGNLLSRLSKARELGIFAG